MPPSIISGLMGRWVRGSCLGYCLGLPGCIVLLGLGCLWLAALGMAWLLGLHGRLMVAAAGWQSPCMITMQQWPCACRITSATNRGYGGVLFLDERGGDCTARTLIPVEIWKAAGWTVDDWKLLLTNGCLVDALMRGVCQSMPLAHCRSVDTTCAGPTPDARTIVRAGRCGCRSR